MVDMEKIDKILGGYIVVGLFIWACFLSLLTVINPHDKTGLMWGDVSLFFCSLQLAQCLKYMIKKNSK